MAISERKLSTSTTLHDLTERTMNNSDDEKFYTLNKNIKDGTLNFNENSYQIAKMDYITGVLNKLQHECLEILTDNMIKQHGLDIELYVETKAFSTSFYYRKKDLQT